MNQNLLQVLIPVREFPKKTLLYPQNGGNGCSPPPLPHIHFDKINVIKN